MSMKVLFLSSDTGGGHRASAESLAKQFELLYPGTSYDLLDVFARGGVPPYNKLVESYKHLSAHPSQWNFVYKVSNSRAFEAFTDAHVKLTCESAIRKSIMDYNPDVVVSVHPMMTNVPVLSCDKISEETGRHLPIFTVVTDLGSAHCLWFANGVDKMFIASDQIRHLAKVRGKVPDEKLVQIGLPIRHQFAVQAELLGDRMSEDGKAYQKQMREELGLPFSDRKTVLIMGGGEGVGSLSNIVDAMYAELTKRGIDAVILVVCGRNEKLKKDLEVRDWEAVEKKYAAQTKPKNVLSDLSFSNCVSASTNPIIVRSDGCMEGSVTQQIRKILSSSSLSRENAVGDAIDLNTQNDISISKSSDSKPPLPPTIPSEEEVEVSAICNDETIDQEEYEKVFKTKEDDNLASDKSMQSLDVVDEVYRVDSQAEEHITPPNMKGNVAVIGLGFVTKMAEYMVAADVLVSKAGPGTIAEAAALSLPVMLTSFLPGQEEGNVDFVIDGEFGTFISDIDTSGIAKEVSEWLLDEDKINELSKNAKKRGAPSAARDIVKQIGDITLKWKKINEDRERLNREAEALKSGVFNGHDDSINEPVA